MPKKLNCWEYKQCGREPNGGNVGKLGVCPAATEKRLHDVHEGINAGRSCWVVAGTYCQGKVQGIFAQKITTCKECDFYKKVQAENFSTFQISLSLLQKLQKG